ncbi:MAG: DUF2478 domain-containing protein [Stellaceae bacterium]
MSGRYLRNLTTGARFSIFHDLGPRMAMCHLDGIGAVAAAAAVRRDVTAGCDLVLLNKFGKLEIAGDGLASAFRAAITAGLPLLNPTGVCVKRLALRPIPGRPLRRARPHAGPAGGPAAAG